MASETLVKHIEQCFHMNARYLGVGTIMKGLLDAHELHPDMSYTLDGLTMTLAEDLIRLMELPEAEGAGFLVPKDFRTFVDDVPSTDFYKYVEQMGKYTINMATQEVCLNLPVLLSVLLRASQMGIAEALSLAKAAMEEGADHVSSYVLGKCSLLEGLATNDLMLKINVNHAAHENAIVFVPDDYVDKSPNSNVFHLRYFDYDLNDSSPNVPSLMKLNLPFIENNDGTVATGHFPLMGQEGTLYRTDDPSLEAVMSRLARNVVAEIEY